jgi:hypothetical protein
LTTFRTKVFLFSGNARMAAQMFGQGVRFRVTFVTHFTEMRFFDQMDL